MKKKPPPPLATMTRKVANIEACLRDLCDAIEKLAEASTKNSNALEHLIGPCPTCHRASIFARMGNA
jgi:hypothetical protein